MSLNDSLWLHGVLFCIWNQAAKASQREWQGERFDSHPWRILWSWFFLTRACTSSGWCGVHPSIMSPGSTAFDHWELNIQLHLNNFTRMLQCPIGLGTIRISWTSFCLKILNVCAFPDGEEQNQFVSVPFFLYPKAHPLLVPLAPSAAREVLHHIQGLQKRQSHRVPFHFSVSTKPSRTDLGRVAELVEHHFLFLWLPFWYPKTGHPETKNEQGTLKRQEELFLPDVSAKYCHCICGIGWKCVFNS